ncbi:arginine--tRNA ligase [Geminicoccaceae bacterium 1502E]|nr:arginine--tRNA ligase [Geminicoccaceae bacterium 1502E]
MNAFNDLLHAVLFALDGLEQAGRLPAGLDRSRILVEPPRDPAHGDAATNAALVLAKAARMKPMAIAEELARALAERPGILEVTPVPPGFVNMRIEPDFWRRQMAVVLEKGLDYGRCDRGQGRAVNIEYCSANPTGPLHVGHGRGTVFGDALANLLERAGWAVTREYYVNDAGAQMELLARSLRHRYLEALGRDPGPLAEGLYPGSYLLPLAEKIVEQDGERWLERPESEWLPAFRDIGVAAMMAQIREDLGALGVDHDIFSSERELVAAGRVDSALAWLEEHDLVYTGTLPPPKGKPVDDWEPAEQLLFRATAYGDDIDRPLKRSNGAWTYFAADLAYHLDKYRRGFDVMVDVWGADHGGYVKRMQAAVRALSEEKARLDVRLCQLVNLMDDGKPLKMSKRAGRIVTLRDVVDEVGKDVFRFIMLTRKNDAPLDFDLKKVTEQSKDNPVFYVQYAHARICSVFRNAEEEGMGELRRMSAEADLSRLENPAELELIRLLAQYPRTLEGAADSFEPHRIAFYLHDLAGAFHGLWTKGKEQPELRFLVAENPELTRARLAMLEAVRTVLAAGLGIIGVAPVSELH